MAVFFCSPVREAGRRVGFMKPAAWPRVSTSIFFIFFFSGWSDNLGKFDFLWRFRMGGTWRSQTCIFSRHSVFFPFFCVCFFPFSLCPFDLHLVGLPPHRLMVFNSFSFLFFFYYYYPWSFYLSLITLALLVPFVLFIYHIPALKGSAQTHPVGHNNSSYTPPLFSASFPGFLVWRRGYIIHKAGIRQDGDLPCIDTS